jgi:zinc transporter ZupT
MQLLELKILSTFAILLVNVIGGAPLLFRCAREGSSRGSVAFSVVVCAAGGLLLSASLLQMLPEAVEGLAELSAAHSFPYAFFACGVGWMFVLAMQSVVQACLLARCGKERTTATAAMEDEKTPMLNGAGDEKKKKRDGTQGWGASARKLMRKWKGMVALGRGKEDVDLTEFEDLDGDTLRYNLTEELAEQRAEEKKKTKTEPLQMTSLEGGTETSSPGKMEEQAEKKEEKQAEVEVLPPEGRTGGFLLLTTVLLESFVSGLSLGMQPKQAHVLVMLLAVVTHDWAEAMALTMLLMRQGMRASRASLWALGVGAISVLGVTAGILYLHFVSSPSTEGGEEDHETLIGAFFMAFAAGNFLYVSTVEMIGVELFSHGHGHGHVAVKTAASSSSFWERRGVTLLKKAVVFAAFALSSLTALYF